MKFRTTQIQRCNYEEREQQPRARSEEDHRAESLEAVIWGHEAFRRDKLGEVKDIMYVINDKNAKEDEAQRLDREGLVKKETGPAQTTLKIVGIEKPSLYDQDNELVTEEHQQVA